MRRLTAPLLILLAVFLATAWIDNPDDYQHPPTVRTELTLPPLP